MDNNIKVVCAGKIYEMLELIRDRPEMWLTSKSISALQNFLNGYLMNKGFTNDIYHPGEPSIDNFKYWVLRKEPDVFGVGNPYSRVLLKKSDGNEVMAFDLFFEFLDEFKREQQIV